MTVRFGQVYQPGGRDNLPACNTKAAQLNAQGTEAIAVRYRISPSAFETKVLTEEHLQAAQTAFDRHFLAYTGGGWYLPDKEQILTTRRRVLANPEILDTYFPEVSTQEKATVLKLLKQLGEDINYQIGQTLQSILSPYVKTSDCIETLRKI
ncbi:MAG: hypothetical protein SFZ03_00330 [Candidatus Melainabacteria bacterium]|nr:hypothetical protein [Candidatus Melainabacteria bacterium]